MKMLTRHIRAIFIAAQLFGASGIRAGYTQRPAVHGKLESHTPGGLRMSKQHLVPCADISGIQAMFEKSFDHFRRFMEPKLKEIRPSQQSSAPSWVPRDCCEDHALQRMAEIIPLFG